MALQTTTNMPKPYYGVLIDPTKRSLAELTFKSTSHPRELFLQEHMWRNLCANKEALDKATEYQHYNLPMDSLAHAIGEDGQRSPIHITDLGNGLFLALRDDLFDQQTKQPAIRIRVEGCTLDPRVAAGLHFKCGILIGNNGRMIPPSAYAVEWTTGRPRDAGGYQISMGPDGPKCEDMIADPRTCGGCRRRETTTSFRRCSRCRSEFYCSRKCQKHHRKEHKRVCDDRSMKVCEIANTTAPCKTTSYECEIVSLHITGGNTSQVSQTMPVPVPSGNGREVCDVMRMPEPKKYKYC